MGATKTSLNRVNIFIAPGFEEEFVVPCVMYFQKAGFPLRLLGVKPGEVVGANGVSICPDHFLDDWKPSTKPQLMILPGGTDCVKKWMIEPRIFRIVQYLLDNQGILALAKDAQILMNSGFLNFHPSQKACILIQNQRANQDFVQQVFSLAKKHILVYSPVSVAIRKSRIPRTNPEIVLAP